MSRLHAPVFDHEDPIVRFKTKLAAEHWWKHYRRNVPMGKSTFNRPFPSRTVRGWVMIDIFADHAKVLGYVDRCYCWLEKGKDPVSGQGHPIHGPEPEPERPPQPPPTINPPLGLKEEDLPY